MRERRRQCHLMAPNHAECNLSETRSQVRYVTVAADDGGMRLDNYLLRILKGVPKSHVYRIVRSGEVRVNRGRARPGTRLNQGDRLRVPPVRARNRAHPPRPPDGLKARVQAAIVEETGGCIVFNKPPGLPVHAGSGVMFGLIEVLRAMRPRAYVELVHRLDRQTSGCLLVAKSRKSLEWLRSGLKDPACKKTYLALLDGRWRGGTKRIGAPLSRDRERGGERMVVVDHEQGRHAVSEFTPLEQFADATLMQVRIETGRTHQIRVHAAHCGHAVAADAKYSANKRCTRWRRQGLERTFLHAAGIDMATVAEGLRMQAPLADDLYALLESLRANEEPDS